ncbi:hypothetical protein NC652_012292 [Populus alba x Populus x berolinensis]|nr:hypothetical protein NC652_012292 [Populus alba x Populus x berolinensis]
MVGGGGGGASSTWRNAYQEIANSKPLFVAIYATVFLGIVFSSLYVLSAVYSANSSSSSTSWLSSPPIPTSIDNTRHVDQSSNFSKPTTLAAGSSPPTSNPQTMQIKPFGNLPHTQRVKDNVIIVTFGNYAFMDFILSWVKHLTDLGLSNLLVGAMDTKLLEALYWKGIPVFDMGSHMSTADVGWGSPTFHKMGREKVILIDAILPYGVELLMCDTDMVWLKMFLTSSDQVVPTVVDDSLDLWQQVGAAYNIGIFHWRPTESAKKLAREWKDMLLADDKIWDQNGFNDIVRKQMGPSVDGDNGLVYAFDGNLKLGVLPASIFCSGHTYFVQAMYQQLRLEPYAVHTTFQYAGTEGKRHRLREAMVFYDPPEYYDAPGGFISFKPSIPKSMLLDGEHNLETHFSLINYQIKQVRTALAIASLLKRTLVMPPLWCRLDRLWFAHPGVLVGSMTRQPFLCPLDHVFEDEGTSPHITFSGILLWNPYIVKLNVLCTDLKVKESRLDVQLCQEGAEGCGVSNNDKSARNNSDFRNAAMKTCSRPHSHHSRMSKSFNSLQCKMLLLASLTRQVLLLFFCFASGIQWKRREEKFRNRMKRYVGIWCCVENHDPGHIYYDMYWDEKSDWKPMPPQSAEDDHPPW